MTQGSITLLDRCERVTVVGLIGVLLSGSVFAEDNPVEASAGKIAYDKFCAVCHGPRGKGGMIVGAAVAANLVDGPWKHGGSDEELLDTIKNGIAPEFNMQPFDRRLSDESIRNLIRYLHYLRDNNNSKR